ncbi:MAG: DUF3086 domain-containing protein [Candidatus Thorarchaeota archaeon]|nr:DUF3086 domain-containing protein [Candidatus Thorarchaeota archaeon]
MGRTVRTFREAIDIEAQRWSHFKRTLRPEEREILEQLFDSARSRGDAGTMMPTRTTEIVLVSAMIDLLRSLKDIESRLTRLENRMVGQTD